VGHLQEQTTKPVVLFDLAIVSLDTYRIYDSIDELRIVDAVASGLFAEENRC
jgi:hypothetical protein